MPWALFPALAGGADSVSAVCRSTMLQTLTPDHLRGRMSATYSMVVMGGPDAGDVEAGAVAAAWGPRVSAVSGGLLCVLGAALVAAAFPALHRYSADPTVAATTAAATEAG